MGEPRQVKNNGVLVWQANKVITETVFVQNADGTRTQVKKKVRLRGTAPTKNLARQRLDQRYKEYLVKTGELPVEALGLTPTALTQTVGEWLETWFKRRENSGEVQSASLRRYRSLLDHHILPHIGEKPLRLFTLTDVNTLLLETLPSKRKVKKNPETGEMEETGERLLGNSPLRKVQDILTQSMKMAVAENKIHSNPMDGWKRIRKQGLSERRLASLGEFVDIPALIVKALYGTPEMGRWTLALMGLRSSERLGVEFSSFKNLENREKPAELHINRQLVYDEDTKTFHIKHRTKTVAGDRILLLPERVREALLDWKKQREEWASSPAWKPLPGLENLLYTTKTGKPILRQNDGALFKKMLRENDIREDIWLHALRHLVATELGIQGVHSEVAKTILGHGSVAMVAYYQHFSKAMTKQPLAVVSDSFHQEVPQIMLQLADTEVAYGANGFYNNLLDGNLPKPTPEQEEMFTQAFANAENGVEAYEIEITADGTVFLTEEERNAVLDFRKRRGQGVNPTPVVE